MINNSCQFQNACVIHIPSSLPADCGAPADLKLFPNCINNISKYSRVNRSCIIYPSQEIASTVRIATAIKRSVCLFPCCLKEIGVLQASPFWQYPSPAQRELQAPGYLSMVTIDYFTTVATVDEQSNSADASQRPLVNQNQRSLVLLL